jgi:hypothetical protein
LELVTGSTVPTGGKCEDASGTVKNSADCVAVVDIVAGFIAGIYPPGISGIARINTEITRREYPTGRRGLSCGLGPHIFNLTLQYLQDLTLFLTVPDAGYTSRREQECPHQDGGNYCNGYQYFYDCVTGFVS